MRKTFFFTLVWMSLLLVAAWGATMRSISKDNVNVRSQPNLKSEVLFQASLGYPIEIDKQENDWVYCHDWKDNAGWIYKPLVSSIQTAVITVDNANIRKGPNLRKPVVMQASKGEIYKVFGEKGQWVKIGYYLENEVIGWVRHDLVWGN
ncbi:MAG: SH3 domain-containing protein [Pseudomonadota bacterium]